MLKYKSLVFLLVSVFTISNAWADTGVDAGDAGDMEMTGDVGSDMPNDIGSDMPTDMPSADASMDVGTDTSNDMGKDLSDSDTGPTEAPIKSTPVDPDYQPEVSSSSECTCRSVQSKSNFGWIGVLLIGGIIGLTRKKLTNKA